MRVNFKQTNEIKKGPSNKACASLAKLRIVDITVPTRQPGVRLRHRRGGTNSLRSAERVRAPLAELARMYICCPLEMRLVNARAQQ